VAAKYSETALTVTAAGGNDTPLDLLTFSPGSSQTVSVTVKNTTTTPMTGLKLNLGLPRKWTATAAQGEIPSTVAPGASETVTYKLTSGSSAFNGDLVARASWSADGNLESEAAVVKARNVSPVKINEFANGATESFIELYNAGDSPVDISGWVLTEHPMAQPIFSTVKIPSGTKLAGKGFYLFGQANSGLAVPAQKGDATVYVRSVMGMNAGDTIEIDTGSGVEARKIANVGTAAGNTTTLW